MQVNLEDARKSLLRVGHDRITGYLKGGMNAWLAAGMDQAHLPQLSVRELHAAGTAHVHEVALRDENTCRPMRMGKDVSHVI
jgi:hypothetical protein